MHIKINATHDPQRRSWVQSANDPGNDFPIQNLPFGLFKKDGRTRGGIALGDQIIDLAALHKADLLSGGAADAAAAASGATLAPLLAAKPEAVSALRATVSDLFAENGSGDRDRLRGMLVPTDAAELLLPLRPAAFTDFCTSIDHIRRMSGTAPPCALSMPVAYNGRASSVRPSGTPVVRPRGQFETTPGSGQVLFDAEPLLDFEVEFGAWLRDGNLLGEPLPIPEAEALIFGCCLVNDWSARGIQFFESMLGPHLGKSFITTISPWIVTMEALAPFRVATRLRADADPAIMPHLLEDLDQKTGAFNIEVTADLAGADGPAAQIVRANVRDLFWTFAQMITHQASNGAPLEAGDLIASGTISGPSDDARACLAEISFRGGDRIELPDGSTRTMLEDGDTVTIRGRAIADGFVSIGFGPCAGTVQPARIWP